MSEEQWLTVKEAGRLLKMPRVTIERWARQGLLPSRTGASGPEFNRVALERWAVQSGMSLGILPSSSKVDEDLLASSLERGAHTTDARAATASEAIEVALSALDLATQTRDELLIDVLERERMMTTGVGHGVALPHTRKPAGRVREPLVSALFLSESLDWAALDGKPVHTVFLVISPDAPRHLDLLSRAAHALRHPGFLDFLREPPDRAALIERLRAIHASR